MARSIGIIGVLGMAGLVAAIFIFSSVHTPPVDVDTASKPQGDSGPLVSQTTGSSLSLVAEPPPIASERLSQDESAFSGTVVDETGAAVIDAIVSWTVLPEQLLTLAEVGEYVHATSSMSSTTAGGEYRYERPPPGVDERDSVLWITHPEYEALSIRLSPETETWVNGAESVLHRAVPVNAIVLDRGIPTEGATVRQQCAGSDPASRILFRESNSGPDGIARISPMPGVQKIEAERRGTRSLPWEGVPLGTVELELRSTFTVSGAILRDPDVPESQTLRVDCFGAEGDRKFPLGSIEVGSNQWGPIDLPLAENVQEYVFRLEGEGIVPRQEYLRGPGEGEHHDVAFRASWGNVVWFMVVDHSNEVVPDATATVRWQSSGRRITTTATVREDGYIPVPGVPSGSIDAEFRAPGYGIAAMAPFVVPEPEPEVHLIFLSTGGRIRGRCLSMGQPVRDFRVTVWPRTVIALSAEHVVNGSDDGSFEIECVTLGDVGLAASAGGLGISDVVHVAVSGEAVTEVVLEIPTGISAHGRVLDASTDRPLSDARVQLRIADGGFLLNHVGLPLAVDVEGSFRILGLPRGQAAIEVSAPGFSSHNVLASARPGEEIELGLIRLSRKQPLIVRLLADRDFQEYCTLKVLDYASRTLIPRMPFDAKGEAELGSFDAGYYLFCVTLADGSEHQVNSQLTPGEDWVVEIDLRGTATVEVEIVANADHPLPNGSGLSATYLQDRNYVYRRIDLGSSRQFVIERLPAGIVQLDVSGPTSEGSTNLGKARVTLQPNEVQAVRIPLGEGDRSLRVVDRDGYPISGATVYVGLPNWSIPLAYELKTDTEGRCLLKGLTGDTAVFHLQHPVHGSSLGVEVRIPPEDEEIELTLDGDVDAEFVFVGKRGPIAGVQAALWDPQERYRMLGTFTDDGGKLAWRGLTPGEYVLTVDDSEYWPKKERIQIVRNGGPHFFALRRRCRVELRAREGGLPRATLPIALQYLDSSSDVASFIEGNSTRSNTNSTTTDIIGVLVLEGTPEGDYRWTVQTDAGELSGTFTAVPGDNVFTIDLP